MNVTAPAIRRLREGAARDELDDLKAIALDGRLVRLGAQIRTAPCGTPAVEAASGAAPEPEVEPRYWSDAMHYGGGVALVGVSVDAQGCARAASIFGSSGLLRLDRNAVDRAMAQRFKPAQQNGRRMDGFLLLPMRYHAIEIY